MTEVQNKFSSSFLNFQKALSNLKRSLSTPITEPRDLSGILKDFEMTYELSWKSLKSFLRNEGHDTTGARDVYTKAFQLGYLSIESPWIEMIDDRNNTAHVYDEAAAQVIVERVRQLYFPAFNLIPNIILKNTATNQKSSRDS